MLKKEGDKERERELRKNSERVIRNMLKKERDREREREREGD